MNSTPMILIDRRWLALLAFAVAACGGNSLPPPPPPPGGPPASGVSGPAWPAFGRSAQHDANSAIATQDLNRMIWEAPMDLAPQQSGNGFLLAHYGSPVISSLNTVLFPVKTGATGGYRIEARSGTNGGLIWEAPSDYVPPPHDWLPTYNLTLTASSRLYVAGSGGKLLFRDAVDSATGTIGTSVFYGDSVYAANPTVFDGSVFVDTPITVDAAGNVYFGFAVTGANPAVATGGVARISAAGVGSSAAAPTLAGDAAITKAATNSAPALSPDGSTLYVLLDGDTVTRGYLVALDSATLAVKSRKLLLDPRSGTAATISDNSTASPTVGPDGDVFIGVLEAVQGTHNARGWLLHFDATLATAFTPGSFGWDDTPSIVPASMVPSHAGTSSYLLLTKYNNYLGVGTGDGQNRIALLDPKASQADFISGIPVMREALTILGPTFESGSSGPVREWCINTAAVDPATSSVLINSEDGFLYRWNLVSDSFTQQIKLSGGLGEGYTPTAVGADGAVYAVNDAVLIAVGK
jgi:hypothetical protein